MYNPEDQLKKIRYKQIERKDSDALWASIDHKLTNEKYMNQLKPMNIFKSQLLLRGAMVAMVLLIGTGITFASNSAGPGDALFPLDLALERLQLSLAGDDDSLQLQFAEERIAEIKKVAGEQAGPQSLSVDLSAATVRGIEVDIFSDQTVIKLEAGDRKYGYISRLQSREELITEIATKYSLDPVVVGRLITIEAEDRASRPEDLMFLNKAATGSFDDREIRDITRAFNQLVPLSNDAQIGEPLRAKITELLGLLGASGKIEIEQDGSKIKIEKKSDGEVRVKIDLDDDSDDDSRDEQEGSDVKEDDSEVFCRGEWRDPEDCTQGTNIEDNSDDADDSGDDSSSNSDSDDDADDDDDNSGSGSSDDDSGNDGDNSGSDDSDDDDSNNSGSDDSDDDSDDDNSGSGSNN